MLYYSLSSWERAGVRAQRARRQLLALHVNPPQLALTLTLTLSQGEREQSKKLFLPS